MSKRVTKADLQKQVDQLNLTLAQVGRRLDDVQYGIELNSALLPEEIQQTFLQGTLSDLKELVRKVVK